MTIPIYPENLTPPCAEHNHDLEQPARVVLLAMMVDRIERVDYIGRDYSGNGLLDPDELKQTKEWHVLLDCLAVLLPEYLRARQILQVADDEETWVPTAKGLETLP